VAQNWERLGDAEHALESYLAALAFDAALQAAQMGAAIELARLGRDAEGAAHLAAAGPFAAEPNHRNRLAIAYASRGEPPRAEALFRAILAEHPEHPGARRNLAHLLRSHGRAAEAAQLEAASPATGG